MKNQNHLLKNDTRHRKWSDLAELLLLTKPINKFDPYLYLRIMHALLITMDKNWVNY